MPVPQRMNVQKALKAKLAGQSYPEIAKAQGVGVSTVHQMIAPILASIPGAEEIAELRARQADQFSMVASRSLAAITEEKLANSSARDLGILAGVCVDKQRLISNQSTSNVSVVLRAISDLEADDLPDSI